MSPWHETQSPRWPVYSGIACVVLAMVIGLLLMLGAFTGDGGGGGDTDRDRPAHPDSTASAPTTSAGSDDETGPGPELVSWSQEGPQLAVLVRNDSDEVIDEAQLRITGRDAAGRVVVSATGSATRVCCTILGLGPDGEYGLYAPVSPRADEITDVTVEYVTREARPVAAKEAKVTVADARLKRYADDTVVTAMLTAHGPVGKYVAVQALLVDGDGEVAQVISGRYWCYQAGTRRRIRLELFHAVSSDLRLDKVVAHPVPAGVPAGVKGTC